MALKVMPEQFARDSERLARFQREAETLASLNHPGIASIYGFEDTENTRELLLELVEGETPILPVPRQCQAWHVVAGFSPRCGPNRAFVDEIQPRAKARDYVLNCEIQPNR